MSTRCQIRIVRDGYPLNLYHHSDGYYSGVGKQLQGWLREILDPIMRKPWEFTGADGIVDHLRGDPEYEIAFRRHGDIEYFYLLDFDRMEFRAYHLRPQPWASEGEDEYDQYRAVYDQMPRYDESRDLATDEMDD